MLVAMVCRDGANRAPSRVAWLDRRVTKRRRPAINKEDINPINSHRSSSPSPRHTVPGWPLLGSSIELGSVSRLYEHLGTWAKAHGAAGGCACIQGVLQALEINSKHQHAVSACTNAP